MIGYVLLVSLAIIMGGIIYTWMKTYVPKDALECPEGTSLIIKGYEYNCSHLFAIIRKTQNFTRLGVNLSLSRRVNNSLKASTRQLSETGHSLNCQEWKFD